MICRIKKENKCTMIPLNSNRANKDALSFYLPFIPIKQLFSWYPFSCSIVLLSGSYNMCWAVSSVYPGVRCTLPHYPASVQIQNEILSKFTDGDGIIHIIQPLASVQMGMKILSLFTNGDKICIYFRLSYLYCDKKWLSPMEKATMVSEERENKSILINLF